MSRAESLARSRFAGFINSPAGRVSRIVVGAAMIGWGYMHIHRTSGVVLLVLGFLPLIAGVFDLCILSALMGGPLSGRQVRELASKK